MQQQNTQIRCTLCSPSLWLIDAVWDIRCVILPEISCIFVVVVLHHAVSSETILMIFSNISSDTTYIKLRCGNNLQVPFPMTATCPSPPPVIRPQLFRQQYRITPVYYKLVIGDVLQQLKLQYSSCPTVTLSGHYATTSTRQLYYHALYLGVRSYTQRYLELPVKLVNVLHACTYFHHYYRILLVLTIILLQYKCLVNVIRTTILLLPIPRHKATYSTSSQQYTTSLHPLYNIVRHFHLLYYKTSRHTIIFTHKNTNKTKIVTIRSIFSSRCISFTYFPPRCIYSYLYIYFVSLSLFYLPVSIHKQSAPIVLDL